MAERVLYTRADATWDWRLTADNGQIIATDSSQGLQQRERIEGSWADSIIGGESKDADQTIQSK